MPAYDTVAVVGVGLIGGSIGLALHQRGLAAKVVGIGRNETNLKRAREVGAIDQWTTKLSNGVAEAELIIVCAPVLAVTELVCRAAGASPPGSLITDAGSTKGQIVSEVTSRLGSAAGRFVGSHPMAGDHRTGPDYSSPDLFAGRKVVVTPTSQTPTESLAAIQSFWKQLGAQVLLMDPEEHDAAVAITSHLPHLVAFALADATPEQMGPVAAKGWQDTTRGASADPVLWQQIFATNRPALLAALDRFDVSLAALRRALANGEEKRLLDLLRQAKRARDALGS